MATADTVAQLLRDAVSRPSTLEALEAHGGAIDSEIALAAATALGELLAASADDVDQQQLERVGLLLNRLFMEASDPSVVYGAAFGEGRMAALLSSRDNVSGRALQKPASELTAMDARSIVFHDVFNGPAGVRGWTKNYAAAVGSAAQFFGVWMKEHPLISK